MKILLVDPRKTNKPKKCNEIDGYYFNFGLMYLKSYLKENGYPDTVVKQYWRSDVKEITVDIDNYLPDVIGFSCMSNNCAYICLLAEVARKKNPKIKIVVGGIHATCCGKSMLQNIADFDYIVNGEGEYIFKELLDALSQKESPAKVQGVSFRSGNSIVTTPRRRRIQDLDSLPFPCYDDLGPEIIKKTTHFGILASRGCIFKCSYCSSASFYENIWLHRSPDNIVQELRFLKQRFPVKNVTFQDNFVSADRDFAKELFELIAREEFGIIFKVQTRPDFMDQEILAIMKKAGVRTICFGVESGSKKILRAANRTLSAHALTTQYQSIKDAGTMGFECQMNLLVGWPQETIRDILQTAKLIKNCKPGSLELNPLIIFPNTPLYKECLSKGLIDDSYWFSNKGLPKYINLKRSFLGSFRSTVFELFLFLVYLINSRSFSGIRVSINRKIKCIVQGHKNTVKQAMAKIANFFAVGT